MMMLLLKIMKRDIIFEKKDEKFKIWGSKKLNCVYRSKGLLVTGVPVNILLNVAMFLNFKMFFVLFAWWFFIVVLSSMAINTLLFKTN